jgi:hypothetical protein
MSQLSRRSLVTSAAALPALVVPAGAHASKCTLPPDLPDVSIQLLEPSCLPLSRLQWEHIERRHPKNSFGAP